MSVEAVSIRDLSPDFLWHDYQALVGESVTVAGEPVAVQVGAISYYPKTMNPYDGSMEPTSKRTMVGVFVQSHDYPELIQLLPGPAQHTRHGRYDVELQQERKILGVLSEYLGSGVLARGGETTGSIVTPLQWAFQTKEAVYESTAPGRRMGDLLRILARAHSRAELSDHETALLLGQFYTSASRALEQLHQLGIKHHHPHPNNFNIDLRTGNATLFDYTFAISKCHPKTAISVGGGRLHTASNFQADRFDLLTTWRKGIMETGLDGLNPPSSTDPDELQSAIGKLESVVVRDALRRLGIDNFTESDVRRIFAAQERLIGLTPDISYPQDNVRQRLRTAFAAARTSLHNYIANL